MTKPGFLYEEELDEKERPSHKDKKVLNFLKWCNKNNIKLELGVSATGTIALNISNCDDEKYFFCGFGKTIEQAVEELQNEILKIGCVPILYGKHEIIYDFPWDK